MSPTIGRIVHYYPNGNERELRCPEGRPLAAIVVDVHPLDTVNLTVFDTEGGHHARSSVPFHQPDELWTRGNPYGIATWPPRRDDGA